MQSLLQNLPVGCRFQPTNEQLLDHYLKNKRLGLPIHGYIDEIQICDYDPWDLIDKNAPERYFFCRREFHKKTGGIQRKRKAKAGHWKRTGKIQSITREDGDEVIGTKTIFVYHDPKSTEFVKHELELSSSAQDNYDFVLCKLMIIKKKKANRKPKKVGLLPGKKGTTDPKKKEVDCNKNKPNKKARKSLSDCDPSLISLSDKQMQEEIVVDSAYDGSESSNHITPDFKHPSPGYSRTYSTCVEGQPVNHLTPDSDNQTPIMMTPTSTSYNGESNNQGACDLECPNEYEMNNTLIYGKDTTVFPMDSDLVNQNPWEIGYVSRYRMSVTSSQMAADLENKIPNDMNAISIHETSSSCTGNQNSVEITTSCPANFDFENNNQGEKIADFSASLLQETPLDFEKQNQYEKNDMPETECYWSSLLDSFVLDTDFEEVESRPTRTDALNLKDIGEEATFPHPR